ncbi:metallophosphoesterase [Clostridium paraputrificum]|uniref:metallophosphoesterase n=1 Tax=Clostridium paraputrificum TaxID=29363 RepID=UPI003D33A03E
MKGRKILTMLLATCIISTIGGISGNVQANTNTSIESVRKVNATFYGDTTSSKGFTWYTAKEFGNSNLQIVEKVGGNPDFTKAKKFTGRSSVPTNSKSELLHKVEATGLKEDTNYFYRVGDEEKNNWSEVGTFKTAPKGGAFTFINIADTQAKTEEEADLSGQTIRKAFNTVKNAEFISLNGDLVDSGNKEEQWDWLFAHSQSNLLNTTFAPVAGNHEKQKNSFIDHFNLNTPQGSDTTTGAYYSYDYSNAHFIVLNNNENSDEYANFTTGQIEWMKKDVKAAKEKGAKWIVVNMHKGPYTTSNHSTDSDIMGENGVRNKVAPIMEELGIDLVLQGHDHIYSRTKALKNGKVTEESKITEIVNGQSVEYSVKPNGTIYVTPNTAGPKVYYKNKEIDKSYYDLFDRADEHHAAIYGPDQSDASRPVRSQIQNFMGITINGDKLTATAYEIDQSKNNAEPYIVDNFGISKLEEASQVTPKEEKPAVETISTVIEKKSPKTGDNNMLSIIILMASSTILAILTLKKKVRKA